MLDLDAGELGAPQRRGVAEQQQRPVAQAGEVAAARRHELPHLGGGEGGGAPLRRPVAAGDAAQRLADGGVAGVEALFGRAVRPADGDQPPAQRRQAVARRERGEVGAHRLRARRHRPPPLPRAPGAEAGEVGAVGAQRLRRVGRGAVAARGEVGRGGRDRRPFDGERDWHGLGGCAHAADPTRIGANLAAPANLR